MKMMTVSGIVENGQIRLADNVHLREKTLVYVIVPGVEIPSGASLAGPKLVHPEQAADFEMKVVEDTQVAGIR